MRRVLVFPAWSGNPYLNLMSLAPRTNGYEFDTVTTPDSLYSAAKRLTSGDVFHLHWTAPILQHAVSTSDAESLLAEFARFLEDLRGRSVRLAWTVHNQLPHELAHRQTEIRLYQLLARSVDLIHIMAPQTAEVLRPICALPSERVRLIPHPSFVGVYGAPVPVEEARRRLGVDPDRPAVLFLGQMRPYKGLDVLLAAMRRLSDRDGAAPTLLLAGAATEDARSAIDATLTSKMDVVSHFDYVHDGEIASWFGAADLAVFPYRAILNSGSVHLASAFEIPVVLPGESHLRAQFAAERWVHHFDSSSVESLAATITHAVHAGKDSSLFDDFNHARSPWIVSQSYRAALDDLTSELDRVA